MIPYLMNAVCTTYALCYVL